MIFKMSFISLLYVTLTLLFWVWTGKEKREITLIKRIAIGVIYGFCAILSTHYGVDYGDMLLNLRDVAPLAAGLFFDPVSGIIAGLVGGIERYIAGTYFGIGAYTTVACSLSTCLAGFLAAFLNFKVYKGRKPSPFYAFFMGAVTEVFHMYVVFITHRNDMKMAFHVVRSCAIPMITFSGIAMVVSSILLYILSGKLKLGKVKLKNEDITISVKFQIWLFFSTVLLLLVTSALSHSIQTRTAVQNAQQTILINIEDAKDDYEYTIANYNTARNFVKEKLFTDARAIASAVEYFGGVDNVSDDGLKNLAQIYGLYEIDCVSKDGFVVHSSNPLSVGYDMNSDDQSRPFLEILEGKKTELAQDFMPSGRDKELSLMFVGIAAEGGLLQVAISDELLQKFSSVTEYKTRLGDRHIGESGRIYIADKNGDILEGDQAGKTIYDLGLTKHNADSGEFFTANVLGEKNYCYVERFDDSYMLIAAMPYSEMFSDRNASAYETGLADILLFTAIFVVIYVLVQKIIINDLDKINYSLDRITNGNLSEVVNVRSSSEFASLSDDINLTVKALKGYIAKAEKKIEEELEFARQIQSAALPKNFKFPRDDFEIFALMDPAKEVGGDFYDFFFVDSNKLALVIADVSGKGIPASLFMMRSMTTIKNLAQAGKSPSEVFFKANNLLVQGNDADMFVTAWMGILDLESGKMVCANAGHEYPAIKRKDSQWELYKDKHGLALAAMEDMPFKEYEMTLEPGDRLFVYTDGVPEAINENEEQFGTDRTLNCLNAATKRTMTDTLPFIRECISSFADKAEQFDDITMLGFEYKKRTGDV